jgi:hypothetical protein
MTEMSATCPHVEVRGDGVLIANDRYDPRGDRVHVEHYDLDAFIGAIIAARERVKSAGHETAWSHNADGHGNCGPVSSLTWTDNYGATFEAVPGSGLVTHPEGTSTAEDARAYALALLAAADAADHQHHLTNRGSYIECACGQRYATPYAANLHAAEYDDPT